MARMRSRSVSCARAWTCAATGAVRGRAMHCQVPWCCTTLEVCGTMCCRIDNCGSASGLPAAGVIPATPFSPAPGELLVNAVGVVRGTVRCHMTVGSHEIMNGLGFSTCSVQCRLCPQLRQTMPGDMQNAPNKRSKNLHSCAVAI